jgi:hypothetical protein
MPSYRDYLSAHQASTWQLSGAGTSGATTVRGTAIFVAQELQPQPHFHLLEPHPFSGHVDFVDLTYGWSQWGRSLA